MGVQSIAGGKVYIGGNTTVADDVDGFEALTWTEIKEVQDVGEFGDTSEELIFPTVSNRRVRRRKGNVDGGAWTLIVGKDGSDAGQTAMRTAAAAGAGANDYNFKVTLDDAPSGESATPTTFYFTGPVMSAKDAFGDASDVIKTTFSVGINSAIIEVAADDGTT